MVYGVIFAGGYGKRLKPLTDDIPKVMLEIKRGYTILDRQLLDFKYSGIDEVYLLVGYKWRVIRERYGYTWEGLKLNYLVEKRPMGTLWALRNCSMYLDDDAIVRNGDTVSDFNLKRMMRMARDKEYGAIIALTRMKSPYAIVETEGERITGFNEKPYLNYYINAGIYYLKKHVYKYLEADYSGKEIERTFFPEIVSRGLVGAYFEDVGWFPVDNFKDLEELRKEYKNRRDRNFGYIKRVEGGYEIFIKALFDARLNIKGRARIMEGRGIINEMNYNKGDIIDVDGRSIIMALENTVMIIS
ncbi:MAG: nucleotidyltransferase family protein [Thermoplasmata archaeon]|jgi:NDP-sugar pyrophosphorylase family protein